MVLEEDDFADAIDFVQKDPDEGNPAAEEEDEIDKKIAEEHEIFKEKEAQRWARPGSAPPLSSPRPDTIRAREEEKLAAAGNPPPSGSRDEYTPPERPLLHGEASSSMTYMMPPRPMSADSASRRLSMGSAKPAALQNILEDRPLQDASADGSISERTNPKEVAGADTDSMPGKWVVDPDEEEGEEVEEVEVEEKEEAEWEGEGGKEEESGEYSDEEYEDEEVAEDLGEDEDGEVASKSKDTIVVPTCVSGRSPSPDVLGGNSRGGQMAGRDPLEDSEDMFEDDLGSDVEGSTAPGQSVAGTDFGDVMHPHTFALQLLTHDLRALPGFQKDSEGVANEERQEEPSLGQMGYLGMSSGASQHQKEDGQARLVAASAAAIMAASKPSHGKLNIKGSGGIATDYGGAGRPVSAPPARPYSALQKKGSGSGSSARPMSAMPRKSSVPEEAEDALDNSGEVDDGMAKLLEASRLLRQSHSQQRDQDGSSPQPSTTSGKPPLPHSSPNQQSNGMGRSGNQKDPNHYWDDASTISTAESGDCLPSKPPPSRNDWQRSTYNGAGSRSAGSRPWTAPGGRTNARPESARPAPGQNLRFARPQSAMPTTGAYRTTWDGNCTVASPTVPLSESTRMTATVAVAGLPVSVYVADTMKRILQVNQWLAKAGSSRRYRLKNPNSNMELQMYNAEDVTEMDGATFAPTLRSLTLKQFLTAHSRLKAQHHANASAAAELELRIRRNSEGMIGESWEYRRSQSHSASNRPISAHGGGSRSVSQSTAWASPSERNVNGNPGASKARPTSARPASGAAMGKSGNPMSSSGGGYHSSRTYMSQHQKEMQAQWDIEEGEDEEVGDVGDLGEYDNECLSSNSKQAAY